MTQLPELTRKLKEIFQIDRADLDFGIYRILNSRSKEISQYLEHQLPQKVKAAFADVNQSQVVAWQQELDKLQQTLSEAGVAPETSPKYQALADQIKHSRQSGANAEASVFSHLLTFFSRYYEEGDFISQRRYQGNTYAIPYNGEEVMLHWANKDQYYTKSGENFSNYRFKLDDGREVYFRLVSADMAKDNRKDNDGKRLFVLATKRTVEKQDEEGEWYEEQVLPLTISNNGKTLEVFFDYQLLGKNEKQEAHNAQTLNTLQTMLPEAWQTVWQKEPTAQNPNRTLLEKHLNDYTQKNTADYFIHKDLGGFLRRELDFYIKNEVMHLDNIQYADGFAHIEASLRQIQVIRSIALELIDFLAQLEDFQKKLWLKKKFVAKSYYLITLDCIPKSLLGEVLANQKQLSAWQHLFDFNRHNIDAEELQQNQPHLVVDTSLYPSLFQAQLLSLLSDKLDLDEATDGLLIHSDNFQALNLLQARYREQVKCIYIDPPYNTEDDRTKGKFIYKDGYDHSTWLTMMENRLCKSTSLINNEGFFACHIDENEHLALEHLIYAFFRENDLGKLIWDKRNPKGDSKGISSQHEYVHITTKDISHIKTVQEAFSKNKENAERMLNYADNLIKKYGISDKLRKEFQEWIKSQSNLSGGEKAYKYIDENGDVYQPVSMGWPNKDKAPDDYFIPLIHPITNKSCPVPKRGWRNPSSTMKELLENNLILFGKDETTIPRRKYLLKENLTESVSSIYAMGGSDDDFFYDIELNFPNPKPVKVAQYFLQAMARPKNSLILDYFAGSGTTAHAVINLNREDGGKRKYILVEQGEYFDTVLKPRVQKVIYSENWKNGKPVADKEKGLNGVSQIVKVIKLESYEDTLNNLTLKGQGDLFNKLPETAKEDYLLHYMLAVESKASLLSTDDFKTPFDYQLNIATDSAGAYQRQTIDLVETFNYLIGLRVTKWVDKRDKQGFVTVEGSLPSGECCLVVWRDCTKIDYSAVEQLFESLNIMPNSTQYDVVYLNGDHNIATQWQSGDDAVQNLKLRPIEPEFLRLMFAAEEV